MGKTLKDDKNGETIEQLQFSFDGKGNIIGQEMSLGIEDINTDVLSENEIKKINKLLSKKKKAVVTFKMTKDNETAHWEIEKIKKA